MRNNLTPTLWFLIGLGALAGLYAGHKRYQVENLNKRVELALDYSELKQQADLTGRPLAQILEQYKSAGITSVAITEDTLSGLEANGRLAATSHVVVVNREDSERIRKSLGAKGFRVIPAHIPDDRPGTNFTVGPGSPNVFSVPADFASIRTLGIGLDPTAVATVSQSGLSPVGRIGNWIGISPFTFRNVLNDLKTQGAQTVVFTGTEVAGFRGLEKDVADELRETGSQYGQIEFGKQKGDERLSRELNGEYVRVHSIGEAELGTLDESEAIDRFVRGARERNIRLCYIRLFFTAGSDIVEKNAEFLRKIRAGISRGGEMEFGLAHTYVETQAPTWAFAVIAVGIAAGLTLLLIRFAPVSPAIAVSTLIVSVLGFAGLAVGLGETGRKLVALVAGLIFPTLACLRRDLLAPQVSTTGIHQGLGASAVSSLRGLLAASCVTAIGIVYVVGLLATRPFMLKANQFMGIKAAHAVPLVVIVACAIFGLPALDRPWGEEWAKIRQRASAIFVEPARIGQLLLALLALATLAMIVARTGNEPGVGVSGLELKFRSLLDKVLPVRPRTKEFLIGHPAFILGLALWYRGRRRWALPLFVVGVIGQVSILNTFCHIHTPLVLSSIRDLTGLLAGAVIGIAVFWLVERLATPIPQRSLAEDHSPIESNSSPGLGAEP